MRFGTTLRITGPVMGVSLLLLLLGISAAWYVHRLQKRSSELLDSNVASILAAEELELAVRDMRYELVRYRLYHQADHLARALELRSDVLRRLEDAKRLAGTAAERRATDKMQRALGPFFTALDEFAGQAPAVRSEEDLGRLVRESLTHDALVGARDYLDLNEQELKVSNQENQAFANRLVLALLLLGTCGSIAGLVTGYGVARAVSRSIFQLSIPIRDVAGKLNEAVGPVSVSADPGLEDLESVLQAVAGEVAAVVEQLHASHHEMMRADQLAALGQLAAGLAHELRNPLMCIKVLVQSARHPGASELDARDLQVLDEEISRLELLLQAFLDFARPAKLEKRATDLRVVAERTVELLLPKAQRCGIEIVRNLPERPVMVDADEAQLRQVVLNLILNALDAVAADGTIELTVLEPEPNDRSRQLCVEDSGSGLPEEYRERIFEPFFSTKETGLGMGLATCRRIIESHGGTLSACNRTDRGAAFTVVLPASSPAAEDAPPELASAATR